MFKSSIDPSLTQISTKQFISLTQNGKGSRDPTLMEWGPFEKTAILHEYLSRYKPLLLNPSLGSA